ncbi:hypothetical protein CHS0354_003056 [Potamilus streckersoni]|uniref:C2H2-type domain-containing protein n=1 Tax=Potamilus streckersoni TaxID=2493646 RepID=A0AAE0TCL7_9BIVA|nr:hypothetical protein CHS0354_003056 [Potamilus streckersoni]
MGSHISHVTCSCEVCTSKFYSNSDLKTHLYTREISEFHVCDVCKKKFSIACVFRQHKTRHTEKRPYKCVQCEKGYITSHDLKLHMRSHTKSKPFAGKTCRKEFSQTGHLSKHQRQHFHNSSVAKPVEFLNKMPVPVNGPYDFPLPTTQGRNKHGSIGENEVEDLSRTGNHGISFIYATSSVSSQPETLSHSRESSPIDRFKSVPNSSMKPPKEDQSHPDIFPLEPLEMVTSLSNGKHPPLHPLRSSLHSVHRIENNNSECNKPVGISSFPDDSLNQQQLRDKTRYNSNMVSEILKLINDLDLTRSTALEDNKLKNCRKMNVKDEKLDELKEEAYAEEENQIEDNTSQLEKRFWLMKHSVELMEMAQHEINKDSIDGMTNVEEEEGRQMIVKNIEMEKLIEDTEMQEQDINTFVTEDDEIDRIFSCLSD